jgi:hypothetical protein
MKEKEILMIKKIKWVYNFNNISKKRIWKKMKEFMICWLNMIMNLTKGKVMKLKIMIMVKIMVNG